MGGICLNWGCIPTKALLRSAEVYHYMHHADAYGLRRTTSSSTGKTWSNARAVSRSAIGRRRTPDEEEQGHRRRRHGKLNGRARSTSPERRQEPSALYRQAHHRRHRRARPRAAGDRADRQTDLDLFEAMVPEDHAEKLLVIGSGAIGIEFASFYNTMGADVTVVESADADPAGRGRRNLRILPASRWTKQGIKIITEAKVTR